MIIKAKYASFDEIPAEYRGLYKQVGSEWIINHEEIEGIADVSNPGLAKNRDEFREEKDKAVTRAETAETELSKVRSELSTVTNKAQLAEAQLTTANAAKEAAIQAKSSLEEKVNRQEIELSKVREQGALILSSKDAQNWNKYVELGTPIEIEALKTDYTNKTERLRQVEFESNLKDTSEKASLSYDVALDFLQTRGKGLTLSHKPTKVKNDKGEEVDAVEAIASWETDENGNKQQHSKPLRKWMEDNKVPEYITAAMFVEHNDTANGDGKEKQRLKIPSNSGHRAGEGEGGQGDKKYDSLIEDMNKNRNARPSPFASAQSQGK